VIADYPRAWQSACLGIRVARHLGHDGFVGDNEYGAYRFLLGAIEGEDIERFIDRSLGPLIRYDDDNDADLVATVETFCHVGGKYQEAARRLNVHVSTLRYRLEKAESLLERQ